MLVRHPELNLSEVARQAWEKKIRQLELLDRLTANSKATDKDIEELSDLIKRGMTKRIDEDIAKLRAKK